MIKYFLLVNKQGQTRLSQYYDYIPIKKRTNIEAQIVRKCLSRNLHESNFFEFLDHKIVYRRYASLFFILGVDVDENELAIYEFIHAVVETFDGYFESVCELDIMFNLEKAHFILDEMISNGMIIETNKMTILKPIQLIDEIEYGD
eukprot:TRINITY_DN2630_c0_g1_i1.p1 TRINITY_DN2630_c0_g1~~TRINITY_DN2630_c0_g1_i1.p1  ORF type:complete len:146 (+),score=12.34 TRINITY_DN2630_c0_g1_i1:77-514(+)